eukprot:TRINITY_DN10232_c0_g2_i2.p1 TRINITY_DN10232_c0_g2~~TRINITY_DN10232_c0_g2_i2.p1  ORF type:complete len:226 (+),score=68.52 TRINITY_DN10232_c0_g2_i2:93-770(+)
MELAYCVIFFFFLMIRRPPRSTLSSSSAASDVYKRQDWERYGTTKHTDGLVVLGRQLQMDSLVRESVDTKIQRLCPDNVVDELRSAERLRLVEVAQAGLHYAGANFEEVRKHSLAQLRQHELVALLKADDLMIQEESIALAAALKWASDAGAGVSEVEQVCEHIRFGLLPFAELQRFEESEWAHRSERLRVMVHQAYKYRAAPTDSRAGLSNPQCTHRDRTYSFV